jgi:predicted RNA-binding protein
MCEFKVIIDGKKIYEDVVYAIDEEKSIKVKTILGETREFQNCKIIEVDVNNAKLVLEKV